MPTILFNYQAKPFKISYPLKIKAWIKNTIKREGGQLEQLSFVFCTDSYLLGLNTQFLKHNTLTDIITFNLSVTEKINGEIYISVERIKENAKKFNISFRDELARVIIHGVLHLLGYKDKKPVDKTLMRKKEDAYLSLRK